MRILWHSNAPWSNTGYGAQTRLFTPRIRDLGHEVAISGYWGHTNAVFAYDGMTVFPSDEAWGNRLLPDLAAHFKADLIVTLMDVWVLHAKKLKDLPVACWVPVDHEPAPRKVVKFFTDSGARPIAMSRFGERMLRDADLDPLYVPHGCDTSVFQPRLDSRAEQRERMKLPQDGFVIGMVAANKGDSPPRKAFPQVLQAFAKFREEHDDAYLYLHCDPVAPRGVQLAELAGLLDIPAEALLFTSPLQLELGVQDSDMAKLYSAFDVLANPSYGEGFGVPILEAQACGLRVIVTDWTAMSELCADGWAVQGDRWFHPQQRSFWKCPSIDEIVQAFREAYAERGRGPSSVAREFALEYDVARVTNEFWRPALAALAETPAKLAA